MNILERSGFDTKCSISSIDVNTIATIEQYAVEDRTVLENTSYEHVKNFKFKPGHRIFILDLPNQIKRLNEMESDDKEQYNSSNFSYMLKTLIDTAQRNSMRNPKGFRYNEAVRYFATYIYLLCGKACYETLSANLPIPQASTICRCFNFCLSYYFFRLITKNNSYYSQ